MPRAADGFADRKAVYERSMVVAAMGVDGENLGTRNNQQDFVVADMADTRSAKVSWG